MRSLFFLAFLPFFSAAQSVDVQHYRFGIELNDRNDTLVGTATLRVRLPAATASFDLNLVQETQSGKGMQVNSVTGPNLKRYETLVKENRIRVHLDVIRSSETIGEFIIRYRGVPADGLIISKTKHGRRSFFADNWPDRGQHWLPSNDHPADKATVEFLITAPDHYQVVANGIQVEESSLAGGRKLTHWKEDVPISTKVMVIGVADFAVQQSGLIADCVPVTSWVYPEDRQNGFAEFAIANRVLPFFIDYVGPYPYRKLANVQSKTRFGGLENANTIFYHENSTTGDGRNEALVAHEIAHQWFGNHATEKTFAHLWLSEGFATYMAILYFEKFYGKDTAAAFLKEDREELRTFLKNSSRPVVDTAETDFMALLNPNSYEKGSWVLHMLRQRVGDSLFRMAIRRYYKEFGGGVAGTDDLQKIFEEVSGEEFGEFFRQWLYLPGIPHLKTTWEYDQRGRKLRITVAQLQDRLFSFPLEFGVPEIPGALFGAYVSARKQTFEFPLEKTPSRLVIDPGTKMLFAE